MSFPTLQSLFEAKSAGLPAELVDALNKKANGADEVEYKGKTYRRTGPKNSVSQPGKWKEVSKTEYLDLVRLSTPDEKFHTRESEIIEALAAMDEKRGMNDYDYGWDVENKRVLAIPKGKKLKDFYCLYAKDVKRGDIEWNERSFHPNVKLRWNTNEALNEAADELTPDDVIEKAIEAMMVRHARVHTIEPDGNDGLLVEVVYEFPEHRNGLNTLVRKALGKYGKVEVQKMTPYHGEYVSAFNIELNKPVKNMAKLVKTLRAKYPA